MGRRRFVGLLVVFSLTLLNIWMARYVIKPLNEPWRFEKMLGKKHRSLSDILVVSVDDIHPIQHLQEAAEMDGKRETAQHINDSALFYTNREGSKENIHKDNFVITEEGSQHRAAQHSSNNMKPVFDEHFLDGRIEMKHVNSEGSNSSAITMSPDIKNIFPAHSNKHQAEPAHNDMHKNNNIDNDVTSTSFGRHSADLELTQLNFLDTHQLINIKNNLESLKNFLRKLSPDNRRSLVSNFATFPKTSEDAADTRLTMYGDTILPSSQIGVVDLQQGKIPHPKLILDVLKDTIKPPPVAAPAKSSGPDVDLLIKLFNETNIDNLNLIVTENTDAVRDLLSKILLYLQHRQNLIQRHHHQWQKEMLPLSNPEVQSYIQQQQENMTSNKATDDYNRNIMAEMLRNILNYNYADKNFDDENIVQTFLRNILNSFPTKPFSRFCPRGKYPLKN